MSAIKVADEGGATVDQIDVGLSDWLHPVFTKSPEQTKEMFENVPNFQFRDDDIMLVAFPKTGTHWMFQLLSMIQARSTDDVKSLKLQSMFEASTADEINTLSSPRVVNTHLNYKFLPIKGLRDKQIKTVVCLRNPKDTAVSYYNHMHGIYFYNYTGKWADWLPTYLDGKFEFSKYTTWLKEWETAVNDGVGFPLHILYYEDLKMNGENELKKLLDFLDVDLSLKLQAQILDKCGFQQMAPSVYDGPIKEKVFKEGFNIFRKGEVGDWKNWLTVEQNDMFDERWTTEMEGSTMFNFKYT